MPRYCHASPRRRAPQQAGRWAPPPDAGSAHGGGLADRLVLAFAAVLAVASSASVSALTTGEPSNSRRNIGSSFMPSTVRNSRAMARLPPFNRPMFPLVPPFSPLLTVTPFPAPVGPPFRSPLTAEQCVYKGEQGGTGGTRGNTVETQGGTGTTERRERSSAGMSPPPRKIAGNPNARLLVPCQAQRIGQPMLVAPGHFHCRDGRVG